MIRFHHLQVRCSSREDLMNWTMEPFMWVTGLRKDSDMERECKFGKMGQSMKAIGRMIWLTVRGDSFIQMEMSMKENG